VYRIVVGSADGWRLLRDVKCRREINTRADVKERVGDCMSCAHLPQERDSSSCCCRGDGTSDCGTGGDFWNTCGMGSWSVSHFVMVCNILCADVQPNSTLCVVAQCC